MNVIIPPAPACFPPSKERNNAILDALDVEHRPEWQPGEFTHCNQAAEEGIRGCGAHIPTGLLANQQQEWIASLDGAARGWSEVPVVDAFLSAEAGLLTVGTLHEEPHGHIVILRGRDDAGRILAWQAGRHNFNAAPLAACFGYANLPKVRWFSCLP